MTKNDYLGFPSVEAYQAAKQAEIDKALSLDWLRPYQREAIKDLKELVPDSLIALNGYYGGGRNIGKTLCMASALAAVGQSSFMAFDRDFGNQLDVAEMERQIVNSFNDDYYPKIVESDVYITAFGKPEPRRHTDNGQANRLAKRRAANKAARKARRK